MPHKKQELMEAVKEYVQSNQKDFYRLAYSYTKNTQDALDVVQEAVCKAILHADSLKDQTYIKTWFYRILVNESINCLRKSKRTVLDENILESISYDERDISQSISLYHAIEQLQPKLRTVIVLRYFEDMKLDEIATVTKSNLSTVKSRLYKGLEILKKLIGSDEFE